MLSFKGINTPQARRVAGFTMIELMIAVTVVAVLAAFAVPAYKDYDIRTKIAGCISAAEVAKLGIAEYHNAIGTWPPDAEEASLNHNGVSEYCAGFVAYSAETGSFQLDIREKALEQGIGQIQPQFTPSISANNTIQWRCSLGSTAAFLAEYLPNECREA